MSEVLSIIAESNHKPSDSRQQLGAHGEALATEFLKKHGYRLILSNFKVPVGRNTRGVAITGEIDIIGLDDDTICFVEVKTRRSDEFTPIITNVDLRKQRQITRTAKIYRHTFGVWDMPYRYDVITVLMPEHAGPEIVLTKGFWTEAKFRKRKWSDEAWREFL